MVLSLDSEGILLNAFIGFAGHSPRNMSLGLPAFCRAPSFFFAVLSFAVTRPFVRGACVGFARRVISVVLVLASHGVFPVGFTRRFMMFALASQGHCSNACMGVARLCSVMLSLAS